MRGDGTRKPSNDKPTKRPQPMHWKPAKLSALIATLWLTSCATPETSETSAPSLAAACVVFEPISASRNDTTETIRQIVQHNRVREIVCGDQD